MERKLWSQGSVKKRRVNRTLNQNHTPLLSIFYLHHILFLLLQSPALLLLFQSVCVCVGGGRLYLRHRSTWQTHCPAPDDTQ
jgi:hypothetical protein